MKFLPFKLSSEAQNCLKRMQRTFGQAVGEYKMIQNGDRIALGLSGGKDSWTLLHLLLDFKRRVPIDFEVIPITVETGFPGFGENVKRLATYIKENLGTELVILEDKFPEIIAAHKTPGTSSCSFCARMRRGALYTYMQANNINKLALGHHADDAIESMMMSQTFNGVLWTQCPVVPSKKEGITLIRPLIFTYEETIKSFSQAMPFPIIKCNCPFEGNPDHKRAVIKRQVQAMVQENPNVHGNLLKACREIFEVVNRKRALQAATGVDNAPGGLVPDDE